MSAAEKALVARLKPMMKGWGFAFQASTGRFVRPRPFGFDLLSWGAFTRGGETTLSPGLGVRHDRVDDVVNILGHVWGEANRKRTTTVYRGLELFPFEETALSTLSIRQDAVERDVEAAVSRIEAMMASAGLSFLERYASVGQCSADLNDPVDALAHPLLNNPALRAYYGVVSAAFSEPDRVPPLIAAYADQARAGRFKDPLAYDVGRNLAGAEAFVLRLNTVAKHAAGL